MTTRSNRKVRLGVNHNIRRFAMAGAAVPLALFAFLEGVLDISSVTNIDSSPLLRAQQWVTGYFQGYDRVFEGGLMVILALSLLALVTDRWKTGAKLKEQMASYIQSKSRISFQTKALNKHAIVSEADADGRYRYVNENWQKVFGYTMAEVIGQRDDLLLDHGENLTNFDEIRKKVMRGDVVSTEQFLRTKGGKRVITHTTIIPKIDKEGNFLGTIAVRTDVTATRVSDNDRFLTSTLRGLQEELYLYTVDDHEILYMNDKALERCGWCREEAKAKSIFDTSNFFVKERFREYLAPLMSGEEKQVTAQARHEKGYVEITTTLQTRQDGTPVFVSLVRDITSAKLEEKRRLENVATVSHELRSPMTSIKGSLRLLKAGAAGELSEKAARLVDMADRNSDRMLAVLDDILDMEKMVAKKFEFKMARTNVADLVNDAIEMNSGLAKEYGVSFAKGNICDEAWVDADANRMMQVLTNLMSNAAKFSPPGDKVVISVYDQGEGWRISVADNGPGIPPEDHDKVFESFTQLAPADGKARKGTGLGLAISAKIVAAHSGKLNFDSTVGEGTTFHIDLPKCKSDGSPKTGRVAIAA